MTRYYYMTNGDDATTGELVRKESWKDDKKVT